MFAVHDKFGTLSIGEIINPVIELANKGIVVTKKQANRFKIYQPLFSCRLFSIPNVQPAPCNGVPNILYW